MKAYFMGGPAFTGKEFDLATSCIKPPKIIKVEQSVIVKSASRIVHNRTRKTYTYRFHTVDINGVALYFLGE